MNTKKDAKEDDDRYETEEFFVYVDLDTKLLDDQLTKSNAKIKFLGIDTENPIMQLNNQLFKGSYEFSMGTHCFFSQSNRPGGVQDACFRELPEKLYDYLAKTDKVLKMKRIFVEEKETESPSELAEGEIEDLEHLRISKSYAEALNQFLKPGEQAPREIIQDSSENEDELENENQMEVENYEEIPIVILRSDEHSEAPPSDEQSGERTEDNENTQITNIEAVVHEEFERLIDSEQFT